MADADVQAFAQRPDNLKKLRACKTCKLIKTEQQFKETHCENCAFTHPDSSNAGARDDYVQSCTTSDYEGCAPGVDAWAHEHGWRAWYRRCCSSSDAEARARGAASAARSLTSARARGRQHSL